MFNFLPVAFHMFVNISSLLIPCLLNVSLLAMQLIFPEDISPEDFESLQRKPCNGRNSKRWCLNDFQPDGGCQWSGGRCDDKPRISPGGGWHTEPPRPAPVQTGRSCEDRNNRGWCTNGHGGEC